MFNTIHKLLVCVLHSRAKSNFPRPKKISNANKHISKYIQDIPKYKTPLSSRPGQNPGPRGAGPCVDLGLGRAGCRLVFCIHLSYLGYIGYMISWISPGYVLDIFFDICFGMCFWNLVFTWRCYQFNRFKISETCSTRFTNI